MPRGGNNCDASGDLSEGEVFVVGYKNPGQGGCVGAAGG